MPRLFSYLAAALVATGCASAGGAGGAGFDFDGDFEGPLGVQLYSFRRELAQDVPGTLARVRALGFDEVELAGTYGMSAADFRAELDRAGLRATSMHVPYERLQKEPDAVMEEARVLGAPNVGVAWVPHEGPFTVETARRTAADFNRFGQAARRHGLQFFYHIHGYEFRPMPDGTIPFDVLMRETDAQAVKYEMDVFWATRPGADAAALLRRYPDRWTLMHIKDMRPGTATNDFSGQAPPDETEVPVGQGMIDYRGVLKAAKEIGLQHYYIEDETSSPFESVRQSIEWLEEVEF